MKLSVNEVVNYASHNVNQAGCVTLAFKALYDQLDASKSLLQMIGNNIVVKAKLPETKSFMLGTFMLASISFDKDGKSSIKLKSITDAVNLANISDIVTTGLIRVRFEADVEEEN